MSKKYSVELTNDEFYEVMQMINSDINRRKEHLEHLAKRFGEEHRLHKNSLARLKIAESAQNSFGVARWGAVIEKE